MHRAPTMRFGALAVAAVAVFGFVIGASQVALAASTVYVDGAGVCAGRSPCFTTIQLGVNNAGPPPATVFVFPGTYTESVDLSLMGMAIGGMPGEITLRTVNAAGVETDGTAKVMPASGPAFFTSLAAFPGDLTMEGFVVQSPDDDGISLNLGPHVLTLRNIVADGNAGRGLTAALAGTAVRITDSSFSNNKNGDGINFGTASEVQLDGVTADGNSGSGATFGVMGPVNGINSSFSNNKNGDGINFGTATEVVFDGVTADGNQNTGAMFGVSGPVHVGNSSFSNAKNGGGIDFGTATEVVFENVTADGNQNTGAMFGVSGPVHVSDSSFSNAKNGDGIDFGSATEVVFEGVTADGNLNAGASFAVNGPVHVDKSSFSNAVNGEGIRFGGATEVVFSRVIADGNQNSGANFGVDGPVHVSNSSFSNARNGDGIAFANATDVIFQSVVASGNSGPGLSAVLLSAQISGSRFERNQMIGVELSVGTPAGDVRLRCNDIDGNGIGLRLLSNVIIDARHNWWGSPSGPTTPANPGGTGDSIVDGNNGGAGTVVFSPFLTAPAAESGFCTPGVPVLGSPGLLLLALGLLVLPAARLARRALRSRR